jgi:beta-lactamase class A
MPERQDWSEVERLAREAEEAGGAVGVTVFAPDGDVFAYHGERRFIAASTIKVPIMVEIYRQIDRGERSPGDRCMLTPAIKTPGSGVLSHLHDGIELTLNDLIYLMISISDNTATNILIDMAGMERVNETIRSLGMVKSSLGRRMLGRPARGEESENWATPNDFATTIRAILDGRAASDASCQAMVAMLEQQENNRRIARYLPQQPDIRWGSKTGSLTSVTNDAGFIATPAGTLILAVFCENLSDQHAGEQVIGEVARAAMVATRIAARLSTA